MDVWSKGLGQQSSARGGTQSPSFARLRKGVGGDAHTSCRRVCEDLLTNTGPHTETGSGTATDSSARCDTAEVAEDTHLLQAGVRGRVVKGSRPAAGEMSRPLAPSFTRSLGRLHFRPPLREARRGASAAA